MAIFRRSIDYGIGIWGRFRNRPFLFLLSSLVVGLFLALAALSAPSLADGMPGIDELCPCAGPLSGGTWTNHGEYVLCVVRTAEEFVEDGLITEEDKGAIVSVAAQSDCGKTVH